MNDPVNPYVVCTVDFRKYWAGIGVGEVDSYRDAIRYDWDNALAIQSWLNHKPGATIRWTVRVVPHPSKRKEAQS